MRVVLIGESGCSDSRIRENRTGRSWKWSFRIVENVEDLTPVNLNQVSDRPGIDLGWSPCTF